MEQFVVGGLYEYIRECHEKAWAYHNDLEIIDNEEEVITNPNIEKYVVLDVRKSVEFPRLLSVKVLSSAGTIGRLYLSLNDCRRLDQ